MAAQVAREQIMRHRAASTHSAESPATADGRPATTARPTQPSSPAPGVPNISLGISMYHDEEWRAPQVADLSLKTTLPEATTTDQVADRVLGPKWVLGEEGWARSLI